MQQNSVHPAKWKPWGCRSWKGQTKCQASKLPATTKWKRYFSSIPNFPWRNSWIWSVWNCVWGREPKYWPCCRHQGTMLSNTRKSKNAFWLYCISFHLYFYNSLFSFRLLTRCVSLQNKKPLLRMRCLFCKIFIIQVWWISNECLKLRNEYLSSWKKWKVKNFVHFCDNAFYSSSIK